MDFFNLPVVSNVIASLIGTISTFALYNISIHLKDRKAHEESMQKNIEDLQDAIKEIHTAEQERMAREQERFATEQERMAQFMLFKEGDLALLRDRLSQGRRYFVKQGYIPQYEFENYESMYKAYKALGGNGMIDRAYADVSALPFEDPQAA